MTTTIISLFIIVMIFSFYSKNKKFDTISNFRSKSGGKVCYECGSDIENVRKHEPSLCLSCIRELKINQLSGDKYITLSFNFRKFVLSDKFNKFINAWIRTSIIYFIFYFIYIILTVFEISDGSSINLFGSINAILFAFFCTFKIVVYKAANRNAKTEM